MVPNGELVMGARTLDPGPNGPTAERSTSLRHQTAAVACRTEAVKTRLRRLTAALAEGLRATEVVETTAAVDSPARPTAPASLGQGLGWAEEDLGEIEALLGELETLVERELAP